MTVLTPDMSTAAAVGATDRVPRNALRTTTIACSVAAIAIAFTGAVAVGESAAAVIATVIAAWCSGAIVLAVRRHGRLGLLTAAPAAAGAVALVLSARARTDAVPADWRAVAFGAVVAFLFVLTVSLPDGRIDRYRRTALAAAITIVVAMSIPLVRSAPAISRPAVLIGSLALATVAAPMLLGRCRRANATERARLQWLGLALVGVAAINTVAVALSLLTGWPEHVVVIALASSVVVPTALVAATFDRLLAVVPRLLVHAIIGAGMVVLATAVYVVVVIGFDGRPSGDQRGIVGLSVVATTLIAVFALPVRRRLETFANQRVYGEQQSPDTALQTFASRMSRAVPMDELLLQLAETLRKSMSLRRAEIWTGSDGVLDLAVSVPDRKAPRITLNAEERQVASRTPVSGNSWLSVWIPEMIAGRSGFVRVAAVAHLGDLLGLIVAERGSEGVDFVDDEDRVLTDIARQLGLALHNVRLDTALQASLDELQVRNAELVASRSRIVAAADESRRQIERNLHDGAQQHLVAMAVKLGLARQLLQADPEQAAGFVEELRDDVQSTLTELRELAHGIYPPLLRSRGLPEALCAASNRAVLPTSVNAEGLPRFDAEVEAAVYFCCLEAIQNAGKHAGEGATVAVQVVNGADGLSFEVKDNGAGFDAATVVAGHGFVNMTDRLGAIGGTLTVTSELGAGTIVRGRVPL